MISIAITGHRPDKLWGYDYTSQKYTCLKILIKDKIKEMLPRAPYGEYLECLTGMALGVDTMFAEIVLEMRDELLVSGISLHCIIPCLNQHRLWNSQDQKKYSNILSRANEILCVSSEFYSNGCMNQRNQYMVDRCNTLIAVWNGDKTGGTYDTIKRAEKAGKEIITINPKLI